MKEAQFEEARILRTAIEKVKTRIQYTETLQYLKIGGKDAAGYTSGRDFTIRVTDDAEKDFMSVVKTLLLAKLNERLEKLEADYEAL